MDIAYRVNEKTIFFLLILLAYLNGGSLVHVARINVLLDVAVKIRGCD